MFFTPRHALISCPPLVEAFLSGINDMRLALVQLEIKTIQHMSYCIHRLIYLARTQHHKIIRIADDSRFQSGTRPKALRIPM